jgi:hypothetical protein
MRIATSSQVESRIEPGPKQLVAGTPECLPPNEDNKMASCLKQGCMLSFYWGKRSKATAISQHKSIVWKAVTRVQTVFCADIRNGVERVWGV